MITRIVSNVKVGCDVQLGPKTLIVGDNATGKSAIVNAIELALTGRASDVAGRAEVGSQADLWALAPTGAEAIEATATVDHGDATALARFSMAAGKRPARSGPLVALPLREVREAILSTGEGGRKWLLGKATGAIPDWRKKVVGDATKLASLPDDIAAAIDAARAKARDARARSNALLDALRVGSVSRPAVTAEQITLAEAALATAEMQRDTLRAQQPPPAAEGAELAQRVLAMQDAHVAAEGKRCAVCGSDAPPEMVERRREGVRAFLAARNEALHEVEKHAAALHEAEFAANAAKAELDQLRAVRAAVTSTSAEAQERQTAAARTLDREADDWLRIAEALGARLTEDVDLIRVAFAQRVQKHLPKGDIFGVELQPFRLGLRAAQGAALRTALSGAEWARVTIAVALAVAPEGAPAIAMPEERAWDAATLARVLDAWRDAPIQIVMTSTIEPARVPEGWTVVHVGDDAKAPAAREPGWCAQCGAVITLGTCDHGVAAPNAPAPPPPADIFA